MEEATKERRNVSKRKSALPHAARSRPDLLAARPTHRPHPWNFTPVGAMAALSGAVLRDRRLAFFFPFSRSSSATFHRLPKLIPLVLCQLPRQRCHWLWLRDRRPSPASLSHAPWRVQVFIVTNFAVWQFLSGYPLPSGLAAATSPAFPFFWNTLAGDAF